MIVRSVKNSTTDSLISRDTFTYDTYGKCISHTGTSNAIFLYNGRDGVITDDNGLCYMRARYYSPEMRRFVNADIVAGEISNAVTMNRFAYANGNPVSFVDPFGLSADRGSAFSDKEELIKNILIGAAVFAVVWLAIMHSGTADQSPPPEDVSENLEIYDYTFSYRSGCASWEGGGRVFFYREVTKEFFEDENNHPEDYDPTEDLLIADFTNQDNPNLYAYQAHKINDSAHDEIVDIMLKYDEKYNTDWNRTKESLLTEWKEHNRYSWASARAQNVDFDNNEEGKGFWCFLGKAIDAALN